MLTRRSRRRRCDAWRPFIVGSAQDRQICRTTNLTNPERRSRFGSRFNQSEAPLKFIRAFRASAPILFFALLLGFVGLGISHVDAKVRAEEIKAFADIQSGCSAKFQIDEDASEECFRAGAARLDRFEYGSLHSLFTNSH
jgi:hypothetical protein